MAVDGSIIKIDEEAIFRRIDFLLQEAKSGNPIRDQTITYAMRVISNFYSVGKDVNSSGAKKLSKRMSKRAFALKQVTTEAEWIKNVINEHQEPLKQVWAWLKENRGALTRDQVATRFKQWPMVTVTREEDILLRNYADRLPLERYRLAEIEIVEQV